MRKPTGSIRPLVLVLIVWAALSLPASAHKTFTVVEKDAPFDFPVGPYLQAPNPTSMTIIWLMNKEDSLGWVEYGDGNSPDRKAFSVQAGLVDADDHVHKVKLGGLAPGTRYTYRVAAKEITKFGAYEVVYGETKRSEAYAFTTPKNGREQVSFLVFNDLHQNVRLFRTLLALGGGKPYDLVLFNGDVMNHMDNEMQLVRGALGPFAEYFASETPYVYVRGNHDARGKFARRLGDYIAGPSESFYYSFDSGPVHFLIMDLGEDKRDDDAEYGGLVAFDAYREAQRAWLEREIRTEAFQEAPFRILVTHIPLIGRGFAEHECRKLWGDLLKKGQIDLHLAGHTHKYATLRKGPDPLNCPVVIGGGSKAGEATVIRVEATHQELHLVMTKDDGEVVKEMNLEAKR